MPMPNQVLSVGSPIGLKSSQYRANEEISRGGTGVVFRALDEHIDHEVAIKVLPSGTRYVAQRGATFNSESGYTASGGFCRQTTRGRKRRFAHLLRGRSR